MGLRASTALVCTMLGCAHGIERAHQTPADGEPCSQTMSACTGERITLAGLLGEMVELSCLARLPAVAYTSHLASSHDQSSDLVSAAAPQWFANRDAMTLDPSQPATLLDVQGAGVITRLWSANPSGTLRVYIDGQATPSIDADMRQLLSGAVAPFDAPFSFVVAGGHNLYFPIAFSRSCRITVSGGDERLYFHVGYRRYPADTPIEPFSLASVSAASCELAATGARLLRRPRSDAARGGSDMARHRFDLDSGDPDRNSALIRAEPGGSVLRGLRIWPTSMEPALLRGTMLVMSFDGQETVRVPLGDLFASGVSVHGVDSLPVNASPSGPLTSRWPMPFARLAQLRVESTGIGDLQLRLDASSESLPWTDRSLLFFAQWRPPETFASKPARDWTLARLRGRGHYVGNVLNIVNRAAAWWGEGDEKIYVDGESFPSHFGTGTEDYYGYAWCANDRFTTAYVGQPLAGARQNFGHSSLYRFHVLDPIPFQDALRFDLEVLHWGRPVDVTYDAVSIWYARPGAQMHGAARDAAVFRIPGLDVAAPEQIPVGAYTCGG
jgi:hypothetical protein